MGSIYRRKQDALLGLDNSSFISTSDSLANAVARYRGEADARNKQVDDDAVSTIQGSRDYARSLYEHNANIDDEYDVSDLEDSDEDELRGRRPSKVNYRPGTSHGGISSKAQKLLGIANPPEASPQPPPKPTRSQTIKSITSDDAESIAPKALRTLGIDSRRTTVRPVTSHERNSPQEGRPFDAEDFRRLLISGQRNLHRDNNSSTDVSSSLSRESTISWRTETPRSSQEVHFEDGRWRTTRTSTFAKRKDSLFDPSAVLTEPFSPMSTHTPFSNAMAEAPNQFTFELPADIPGSYYGSENAGFIAELPADIESQPIYEMPAVVPEVVELPAGFVDSSAGEQGILHPDIPELHSGSPPKASRTKVVGESSPSKTSLYPQRTMTAPTRAVSAPRSNTGGFSPTSVDVNRQIKRRPTVDGMRMNTNDAIAKARINAAFARSRSVDPATNTRSIEYITSPMTIVESPTSPSSPKTLGMIAAKAGTGRRRKNSTSDSPSTMVRSKFNPEALTPRNDMSRGSTTSLREQVVREREDDDTTPTPIYPQDEKKPLNDEVESPITGHLAGHPAFNTPVPFPAEEKIFLDPHEEQMGPPPPYKDNNLSADSPTITNLKKQGFI